MEDDEIVILGSLMEGQEVDLIALSGVQMSNDEREKIWKAISPRDLLVQVLGCVEIEREELDDVPGMSDSKYEYRCGSRQQFIERLSAALLSYVRKK